MPLLPLKQAVGILRRKNERYQRDSQLMDRKLTDNALANKMKKDKQKNNSAHDTT